MAPPPRPRFFFIGALVQILPPGSFEITTIQMQLDFLTRSDKMDAYERAVFYGQL